MKMNLKKVNDRTWYLQVEDTKSLFVDIGVIRFIKNEWLASSYGHPTKNVRDRYEAITHIMLKRGLVY